MRVQLHNHLEFVRYIQNCIIFFFILEDSGLDHRNRKGVREGICNNEKYFGCRIWFNTIISFAFCNRRECAALEPSLSRTPHAVGLHLHGGFLLSRADASRGSIEKYVNRSLPLATNRVSRLCTAVSTWSNLAWGTQAVNIVSKHLCLLVYI